MALSPADVDAIRAAEQALARAFEDDDPAAWVGSYTEDAIFSGPGGRTMEGREAFLATTPNMSSLEIVAESTIGDGDFAATMGRASWVTGALGSAAPTVRRRFLMVWRRDGDGQWRIAREQLTEAE